MWRCRAVWRETLADCGHTAGSEAAGAENEGLPRWSGGAEGCFLLRPRSGPARLIGSLLAERVGAIACRIFVAG